MKTSQLNPTPSGVLGTMAKLIRLADVEWSHWLRPTNNVNARRNLAEYLKAGCPKVTDNGEIVTPTLPEGEDFCRLILGDDYLSPEDVAKAYGWSYTKDQLVNFTNTLPDMETVLWLRSNGYMLVATPSTDCNLLQVCDLDNQIFYSQTEGWYDEDKQKFARNDVVKAGEWLMIRKEPYADSRKKNWDEQQKLLTEVEHVPNAPEMTYAVTAYFKVRGIYLLKGVDVRTSSVDADGGRVIVGNFDAEGLIVNFCYGHYRRDLIGVGSSRKNLDCLNT